MPGKGLGKEGRGAWEGQQWKWAGDRVVIVLSGAPQNL